MKMRLLNGEGELSHVNTQDSLSHVFFLTSLLLVLEVSVLIYINGKAVKKSIFILTIEKMSLVMRIST